MYITLCYGWLTHVFEMKCKGMDRKCEIMKRSVDNV